MLAKTRRRMTTASIFSRQNDAGSRSRPTWNWENFVLLLVLESKRKNTQKYPMEQFHKISVSQAEFNANTPAGWQTPEWETTHWGSSFMGIKIFPATGRISRNQLEWSISGKILVEKLSGSQHFTGCKSFFPIYLTLDGPSSPPPAA